MIRKYSVDECLKVLHQNTRKRAKFYKKTYTLSLPWLKQQWKRQNGKCAYLKRDFQLEKRTNERNLLWPSIDRIDSSKGYIRTNVHLCFLFTNLGMNNARTPERARVIRALFVNSDPLGHINSWSQRDLRNEIRTLRSKGCKCLVQSRTKKELYVQLKNYYKRQHPLRR